MKKITSIVITFLLFCSAYADTINSASKNTSVAVYGTQRTSTAIQPWVIPVAVAGAACNSTTDIVAVTSDHSSQLICQSGTWKSASGSSGVGMVGILSPLAGKTISCSYMATTGYAMVDANGNPFTRFKDAVSDTGWIAGFRAQKNSSNYASWILPTLTHTVLGSNVCTATWPNN